MAMHTTTLRKEIVNGLAFICQQLEEMQRNLNAYKWAVIGIDNTFQNALTYCFADTVAVNILREKIRPRVLAAIEESRKGGAPNWPNEKLDEFPHLLDLALESPLRFVNSQPFKLDQKQKDVINAFHDLRNRFIHFHPHTFIYDPIAGLGDIELVIECIRFLIFESGNFVPDLSPEGMAIGGAEMEESLSRIKRAIATLRQLSLEPTD